MSGSAVWDLLPLLEGLAPDTIGVQYDVRHAVLESGTSWEIALRRLAPWIRTIVVKDGYWKHNDDGTFAHTSCPIGTGMVDWERFSELLPETGWDGITSVHFEFPLFDENPASLSTAERTKKDGRWDACGTRARATDHLISAVTRKLCVQSFVLSLIARVVAELKRS